MRILHRFFLAFPAFLGIILSASGMAMSDHQSQSLAGAQQLILVTTADWDAVRGEMQRYERRASNEAWRPVGEAIPVVVGRNGMAWGKGLHGDATGDGPIKKEGDGRSPAGIFSLSSAFGYETQLKMGKLGLPYVQAVATLECVDDVKSAYYNRVLDRKGVKAPDWKSSEQMLRPDGQYRLGVVVDHNAGREAGCGSCIFLHIWDGPEKGTAGCTAMGAEKMEAVLGWLHAEKQPLLVQLPQAELERLRKAWSLPASRR